MGPPVIFSQTVEYALRSVVWLASHSGGPQTVQQIAEATQIPSNYLAKVMNSLRRTGLVESRRGLGGGYVLTRTGNELTVLDVVNTVDPIKRIVQCPLGLKSHGLSLCPLHKRLDEAIGLIEKAFVTTKIADLVVGPDGAGSICGNVPCDGPEGGS
jgi:Rrf2 family transcriptional regulator, nitric oxide-sensitive transcriptional repressor